MGVHLFIFKKISFPHPRILPIIAEFSGKVFFIAGIENNLIWVSENIE